MLRLVEADGVGFPMGTAMGAAAGLYGVLISINATSADKPRFLECRNVTATAPEPMPMPVPLPMRSCEASCDVEDSMGCDGMRCTCVHCWAMAHGVLASVCLSVRMRPGAWGQTRVGGPSGWQSLAFASPMQMHRVPGARRDSPLLAPFSMLRLLLVPPTVASGKQARQLDQTDACSVQRSGAAVADHCQSDNLEGANHWVAWARLSAICLLTPAWLMGEKKPRTRWWPDAVCAGAVLGRQLGHLKGRS